jgi:hypothetical protein
LKNSIPQRFVVNITSEVDKGKPFIVKRRREVANWKLFDVKGSREIANGKPPVIKGKVEVDKGNLFLVNGREEVVDGSAEKNSSYFAENNRKLTNPEDSNKPKTNKLTSTLTTSQFPAHK